MQRKKYAWYVEKNIIEEDKATLNDMEPWKTHADGNKILGSIGDWLKKKGFSYHNPDHCMAFTK